jgi:hypothetical protein
VLPSSSFASTSFSPATSTRDCELGESATNSVPTGTGAHATELSPKGYVTSEMMRGSEPLLELLSEPLPEPVSQSLPESEPASDEGPTKQNVFVESRPLAVLVRTYSQSFSDYSLSSESCEDKSEEATSAYSEEKSTECSEPEYVGNDKSRENSR